jgi:creatinine amidohydrolase
MGYSIFDETMVDMTWPQIEKAAGEGVIVLLPVGIIEEHGPHMGLAVDIYIAYLISLLTKHELKSRGIASLIAPPSYWGVSPGTSVFPGTFSMRQETMQAVVYDILAGLHSWGFKRVFAINGHGDMGHCLAILDAIKDARRDTGIDALYLAGDDEVRRLRLTGNEDYILVQSAPPSAKPADKYVDLHAGSFETGVMAKYFPQMVDVKLAKELKRTELTFDDLKVLGERNEATRKLIPNGYFGNPAAYDVDLAGKGIEAGVKSTADCIERYLKKK